MKLGKILFAAATGLLLVSNSGICNPSGKSPISETISSAVKPIIDAADRVKKDNSLEFVADMCDEAAQSVVGLKILVEGKRKVGLVSKATTSQGEEILKIEPKVLSFESKVGDGSGFIISKDGYIVTNAHVVTPDLKGKTMKIQAVLSNNKTYTAEIVGVDEDSDIAVIKIAGADDLNPIKWGNSSEVRPGEFAVTIGSSLGAEQTVGFGIISAVSRKKPNVSKEAFFGDLDYIQTYAQINPGNSGGPLINMQGEVIGITSFIQVAPHSPGFAIPSDYAKNIVAELIKEGYVKRPSIGISILPISSILGPFFGETSNNEQDGAVVVQEVKPSGPSEKAGIRPGDIILKIDGKAVESPATFIHEIRANPVGTRFQLDIFRRQSKYGNSSGAGIEKIYVKSEYL